jgi:hypothetical protein
MARIVNRRELTCVIAMLNSVDNIHVVAQKL